MLLGAEIGPIQWRLMKTGSALDECYSIQDLRALAQRRLPAPIFHFMDGGAETETTLRRNTAAFDDEQVIPRCLVDVSTLRTAVRILGQDISFPVFCSPTGASRLFDPEGELAVGRACASAGTLYCLTASSTYSIEDVAAVSHGPKVFQLYVHKDRDITRELIERCRRAGYVALCLTVDVPVVGNRERSRRAGFSMPQKWTVRRVMSYARRPVWLLRQAPMGRFTLANFSDSARAGGLSQAEHFAQQLDPSVTWKEVREIIDIWDGPFALKGVMSVDDARRAADEGVTAIIVSNHGGRQLDGGASPFDVLPEIARAVGDRVEIILEGGIRRGVHVLKALSRGAKACSIGRPYLYGLSAGGEAGVLKALDILRTELETAMRLAGCVDVNHVDLKSIRRPT